MFFFVLAAIYYTSRSLLRIFNAKRIYINLLNDLFLSFFDKNKTQDSVLTTPQPNYEMIKQCYPHYFHKLDRTGNYYCFFCQPGLLNMQTLTDNNVCSGLFVHWFVHCLLLLLLLEGENF